MNQKAGSESQATAFGERIDAFLRRRQTWLVAAMCGLAVMRILVFAAAFPLFNSVDEQDHYEMVHKFAQGYVQGKELPLSDPEMARVFTLYGSPEYLKSLKLLQSVHMDVPIAARPPQMKEIQYRKIFSYWTKAPVMEAQSPPVYYMVASVWYKVGAVFGMTDWLLAYWVRFFNAILYAVFVWISYLFVKQIYPERIFLTVGVPALLTVFPQDVFYGVNRDILSPLLAALVLLLLFRAMQPAADWYYNLIAGGFLTGLAFLTDVSNFVLFGVLAIVLCVEIVRTVKAGGTQQRWMIIAGAAGAAVIPPLLWMARNRLVMGDLTGSKAKTDYLGWTLKPWHEIWQHPIFTARGANYFLQHLIPMYWRGEYAWGGNPLRWSGADRFYVVSSYLLLAAFAAYLLRREKGEDRLARLGNFVSLYLVLASVLFLAGISLPFDFHQCYYPSRALPYFLSGRIISGTILPFVLIYLMGFEYLWRPFRKYVHPIFPVLAICSFIIFAEISIRATVFHSHFNFFALRGM
jgi:hypothetical protein